MVLQIGDLLLGVWARFARLCGITHPVWTAPHLLSHSTHLDAFSMSDAIGNMVSLGLPVVASIFLVVFTALENDVPGDLGPSTA
jgi:hypothetical protein